VKMGFRMMNKKGMLILFFVLWTTQAVYGLGEKMRVVVLGSSTSVGVGASPIDSSWVSRYIVYLKSLNPQNEVINLAKSGYTTYHLLPDGYDDWVDPNRNITRALTLQSRM
jgi:lysophospholipase L1-like esterase